MNIDTKVYRKHENPTIGNTVLCDGFLVPMTDFVNNVGNMENYPSHENALSWIYNYATFLRQPLKLEMFMPCDEKGNVLEEPQMRPVKISFDEEDMDYDAQELYDYIKAKEKVLFEGFEFVSRTDGTWLFKINGNFPRIVGKKLTIESLRIFKDKIKLSQIALDSIFGETVA